MALAPTEVTNDEVWPPLPFVAWQETLETLHRWTQIVGKVKLALCPFLNEWWQVTLHLTARGLTTGPVPYGPLVFQVDFDFLAHALTIQTSDGRAQVLPLRPRSVADFYRAFLAALRTLGIEVTINPIPSEIADPIPCDQDHVHAAYDPDAVHRWWRILVQTERVLQRYRSPFVGKSSPVHFFWGSFDLNHARFSGRPAPPLVGAPRFFQLAEDQENIACGFWPGQANHAGVVLGEPAFYAYIYPAPPGIEVARVQPSAATYDATLGEFILRYEDARRAPSPEQAILEFFRSTYEVSATLAGWDRATLERPDLPEVLAGHAR